MVTKEGRQEQGLFLEYNVPFTSKAEIDGDFIIEGIAINETITSNGHKFLAEELDKSAMTLIGVPLLKDHNNSVDAIVGKVKTAHFDQASKSIPFRAKIVDKTMKQLVRDGLLNSVSVGAQVNPKDIEEDDDGNIVPHGITFKELSLVAVGADPGASFGVALKNAMKLHSNSLEKLDNTERGSMNMTEEEQKETSEEESKDESQEESKEEETKEEDKVDESAKLDERIKELELQAKRQKVAKLEKEVTEADKDEEEKKEDDEDEEDEDVEEDAKYSIKQEADAFVFERSSYSY